MYLLSLRHSSGEPIQQETILAVRLVQVLVDHVHNHLIRHQLAFIHDLLEAAPELRPRGYFGPKHVAGRQMTHTVFLFQFWSLTTLKIKS